MEFTSHDENTTQAEECVKNKYHFKLRFQGHFKAGFYICQPLPSKCSNDMCARPDKLGHTFIHFLLLIYIWSINLIHLLIYTLFDMNYKINYM